MRHNILITTMLVFCIAFICLSSVSAADSPSAIDAVNDTSPDANLVIDEINTADADYSTPVDGDNNGCPIFNPIHDLKDEINKNITLNVVDGTNVTAGCPVTFILGDHILTSNFNHVYIQIEDKCPQRLNESYAAAKTTGAHYTFDEPGSYNVRLGVWCLRPYVTDYTCITVNPAADDSNALNTDESIITDDQVNIPEIDKNIVLSDVMVKDSIRPSSDECYQNFINVIGTSDIAYVSEDINRKDYEKQYVDVYLDIGYGLENTTVTITPTVKDSPYVDAKDITGGVINFYSDYFRTELIASVAPGESFNYTVPLCPDDFKFKRVSIFYEYKKYDDENGTYYFSAGDLPFISMNTNRMEISVKDSNGKYAEDGIIEIKEGDPIFVTIEHLAYCVSTIPVKIMVEGHENSLLEFNFDYVTHEIVLDSTDFPEGEYVIYVVFDEYVQDGIYFASGTSNPITVKISNENPLDQYADTFFGIIDAIKNIEDIEIQA